MKRLLARLAPHFRLISLFVLLALAFVYAMFQGGFVSWFLFFSFIPFFLYSMFVLMYPLKKATVERSFHRGSYQAGDEIRIEVKVRLNRWLPLLFVIVEDQIPERLDSTLKSPSRTVLFPLLQRKLVFSYTIAEAVRGEHLFTGIELKVADILGFYDKAVHLAYPDKLLIYPSYERISYRQTEASYEEGHQASMIHNHSESSIVSGVRAYSPGDRLSWIHWKATAKKNEFMTKEFEERKSQDAIMILDQSPSPLFEEMVTHAASLTHTILKKGKGIGYLGTGQEQDYIPIGYGEQQRRRIFYTLAKTEDVSESPFEYHLNEMGNTVSNTSYIVLTSKLTVGMINALSTLKGNSAARLFVFADSGSSNGQLGELKALADQKGVLCELIYSGRKQTSERGVS